MKAQLLLLALLAGTSLSAFAGNDVYGTVKNLNLRSDSAYNDHIVYVYLNVMKDQSSFAGCVANPESLVWNLDMSSPVAKYQYELLLTSYIEQLPLRITGQDDVCKNGPVEDDIMVEVSPWGWPEMNRSGKKVKEK
ncbi:hypothetical protein ACSLBF_13780 [Pseudoalteromonas sp. T1lg65]|uniref:hypothetical protein n=1 Tax=Pseudoalteromonas sp. T1lg65 TaxID=2077101 RepID=UPI003F79C573